MRYGGDVQDSLSVDKHNHVGEEPGPRDQRPQLGIDTYIRDVIIPEYGGTINLWKEYLNEVSFHESGDKQRWDINARQLVEPGEGDKTQIGKLLNNIFGNEQKNRLVPSGVGKSFGQIDNRDDASGMTSLRKFTEYAGIDPMIQEFYNAENSPHIFAEGETYPERPPFSGQLNMLPGVNPGYRGLVEDYLRNVRFDGQYMNRYKIPIQK